MPPFRWWRISLFRRLRVLLAEGVRVCIHIARSPVRNFALSLEHPTVTAGRVRQDLPPVFVEVRKVKTVCSVLVDGLGYTADSPTLPMLDHGRIGAVDVLSCRNVQAVVVEE